MTIDYLINPKIEWTVHDSFKPGVQSAEGRWMDWEFTVTKGERGGWNIKINGVQAWTHMRGFNEAMGSVKDRLRDWAYMNQFRKVA
jgi:hypothetical protein